MFARRFGSGLVLLQLLPLKTYRSKENNSLFGEDKQISDFRLDHGKVVRCSSSHTTHAVVFLYRLAMRRKHSRCCIASVKRRLLSSAWAPAQIAGLRWPAHAKAYANVNDGAVKFCARLVERFLRYKTVRSHLALICPF